MAVIRIKHNYVFKSTLVCAQHIVSSHTGNHHHLRLHEPHLESLHYSGWHSRPAMTWLLVAWAASPFLMLLCHSLWTSSWTFFFPHFNVQKAHLEGWVQSNNCLWKNLFSSPIEPWLCWEMGQYAQQRKLHFPGFLSDRVDMWQSWHGQYHVNRSYRVGLPKSS